MNNREMLVRVLEALRWPVALVIIIAILHTQIAVVVDTLTGRPTTDTSASSRGTVKHN